MLPDFDSRTQASSPRPWGCFLGFIQGSCFGKVVPTPVGVFPEAMHISGVLRGRPHARGGVSASGHNDACFIGSSPRPWGCFWPYLWIRVRILVVPTPVGVFLKTKRFSKPRNRRPHARGGVSGSELLIFRQVGSSPRPWGCFRICRTALTLMCVVPTPVGVFLLSWLA